jgi:hypothetical protein
MLGRRQQRDEVGANVAPGIPADLAANGILGRGALVDVYKQFAPGGLIQCTMTVGVRLVDGTPSYRATVEALLAQSEADMLLPGQTFMTVRADPNDHSRVVLSLADETPVVTINDPAVLEPTAQALREGAPIQVTVVVFQRQWLASPEGHELYAIKVRVPEGSELQINVPVPVTAMHLLQNGATLPAKRLPADPNVIAIDWAAAT